MAGYPRPKERVAKMLLAMRSEAGLSQEQAAREIGVSQPYLSDLERGRKLPSHPDTIMAIARVYRQDSDWLFYVVGRTPPDIERWLFTQGRAGINAIRSVMNG